MALLKKLSKKEQITEARRMRRKTDDASSIKRIFQKRRVMPTLLLATFGILVVLVCFVGQSPAGPQVLPNHVARLRIVADFPFSYESKIKTEQLKEQRRQMVAPVYRISTDAYDVFRDKIIALNKGIDDLAEQIQTLENKEEAPALIQEFTNQFSSEHSWILNTEDVSIILEKTKQKARDHLFTEALIIVNEILRQGIYDPADASIYNLAQEGYFFSIEVEGSSREINYQSQTDALRFLRINLSAIDNRSEVSKALFHIFKSVISPNLVYDADKSAEKINAAVMGVEPVYIYVDKGQTIVEPGTLVTDEVHEQITAYREKIKEEKEETGVISLILIQRITATFIVVGVIAFYIRIALFKYRELRHHVFLPALLVLLNLGLIRLFLHLGEMNFFSDSITLMSILPFAVPITLAPILTTLLIGARPAVLVAIIVSLFNTMMQGTSSIFFVVYLLATLIGVYFSLDIRARTKVFQACILSGISVAAMSFLVNVFAPVSLEILGYQVLSAILMGMLTGIIVIGLRPLLENAFKITTDFKLLELTDYNHPLLRKMQMEAPGTYHHSLMVANLSERAAAEIEAQPLLCRAGSLFHDIGKLTKPEYFVENQREGINPHNEKTPSMSALIIKSHVKEGIEIAKEYKLPQPIIDIIDQHHGTSLIQFFYAKALMHAQENSDSDSGDAPKAHVPESNFRYEGQTPQFKESAIISLADSVEAASRSLKKVSLPSIEELINDIFEEKINDQQLDDAPLTLQELYKIKKSFTFTILDMLHSRIEYPKEKEITEQPKNVNTEETLPEDDNS